MSIFRQARLAYGYAVETEEDEAILFRVHSYMSNVENGEVEEDPEDEYAEEAAALEETECTIEQLFSDESDYYSLFVEESILAVSSYELCTINPENLQVKKEWKEALDKAVAALGLIVPGESPAWHLWNYVSW